MNNISKTSFFFFALTGWILALMVHLSVSLVDCNLTEKFPFFWLLHAGVIAIWIPVILHIRNQSPENHKTGSRPKEFYKHLFKDTPCWLRFVAVTGFVYAVVSFLSLMLLYPETSYETHGEYFLKIHGKMIRTISESEYRHYQAVEARIFSGHWIAFYGIACAALYPFRKQTQNII